MMTFDISFFHIINDLTHKSGVLDFLGIFFASYLQYLLVGGFLVIAYLENSWQRRWGSIAAAAVTVLIGRGIIAELFYFFVERPRPFIAFSDIGTLVTHSATNAFPSGHATVFFGLAMVMYFLGGKFKKWSYIYGVLALLMGVARVFVGVHYPLDIVGGLLVGILSAWVGVRLCSDYAQCKEKKL